MQFTLVDLAGSERAADTLDADRHARNEGADINRSLLTLKECIRTMEEGCAHVPFRGSKLTQILRDSFTASSSHTVMIAHVAPANRSCDYSLNSLRYADRLKASCQPSTSRRQEGGERDETTDEPTRTQLTSVPCDDTSAPPRRVTRATKYNSYNSQGANALVAAPPQPSDLSTQGSTQHSQLRTRDAALNVLREILGCAYDPKAWREEISKLEQRCGSDDPEQLVAAIEHIDSVRHMHSSCFNNQHSQGMRVCRYWRSV